MKERQLFQLHCMLYEYRRVFKWPHKRLAILFRIWLLERVAELEEW